MLFVHFQHDSAVAVAVTVTRAVAICTPGPLLKSVTVGTVPSGQAMANAAAPTASSNSIWTLNKSSALVV